ncbi:PKD domain-containing protein [Mucilaginibacter conchicola]|uniref:PKD domain-containing protein n=1 Tax=Mucilaginibacter conchicola TaxID=2303333 RepID=A0A372NRS5_9SPHI|nr:PKD domain-containing protein [Mucilaginibacter conchicola]RFZ91983.1 PKD domain-containing protein [Mucilaginibacter conchicola]
MKKQFLQKLMLLLAIPLALLSCKKGNPAKPDKNDTTMPVAQFDWNGAQRINSEIQFVNKSRYADSYKWDFGDGQISTKANPDKIKYAGEGTYEILLTAIKGTRKAFYKQVIYIAPDNNPAPFFTFEFKDNKSTAPATVVFKNQSVNAQTYKWKINGTTYNEANPTHTFNQPGKYLVELTAINGNVQATYSDEVEVDVNTDPQAGFSLAYHPYPYTINEPIQFVNTSKNADAWDWTFGANGPAASTEQHPEVKFAVAGSYTVTLVAKKGTKQSAPKTITIKINP